jgi:DNA invertase Pin-like site-specific DNA recombinase
MPIKRGREQRPAEAALLNAIRSRSVNRVMIFSIDRAGRSLAELVGFLETCRTAGVSLYVQEQNLDTVASNGLTLFDVAAMMALHLRQGRRDRILRGQAAARNANVRFGRPPMSQTKVDRAKRELAAGKGVRQVARLAGISAASVSRLKNSTTTVLATA